MYDNLERALRDTFKPESIVAQLGYSFDDGATYEIFADTERTLYWARFNGTFGKVRHRGRVGPAPGMWVYLQYEDDGVLTIIGQHTERNKQYARNSTGMLENGLIPNDRFFGGHPLDLRMILQNQLRIVADLEIKFLRGWYVFEGVLYAWDDEVSTLDLTSLLPGTDLMHRWAVVGIKTDVNPHELHMAAGAEQSVGVDLDFAGLATVANDEFIVNNYIPLDGVQLRYTQTKLVETDFEAISTVNMPVRTMKSTADEALYIALAGL